MLAGEVDHKDTIGNAGTIGPGDVQWMTAGGGIMHEEMPRPREGKMGGFQLWVNMPAEQERGPATRRSPPPRSRSRSAPTARGCASWPVPPTACRAR